MSFMVNQGSLLATRRQGLHVTDAPCSACAPGLRSGWSPCAASLCIMGGSP